MKKMLQNPIKKPLLFSGNTCCFSMNIGKDCGKLPIFREYMIVVTIIAIKLGVLNRHRSFVIDL